MTPFAWAVLAALVGCGGGQDPQMVMEMNCTQCGRGEDVHAGCDACAQMARAALQKSRPDIDKARSLYAQACQVHHPPSCLELARLVRDGRGGPRDLKRAAELFKIACDKGGLQAACTEVGIAAYDGTGMKKNPEQAVELFQTACFHEEDPQPKACAALGLAYLAGKGVEDERKDEDKAIELLQKACDFDYAAGCVQLGDLFAERRKGRVKENREQAAKAYQRACKLDARYGCYELALMHQEKKVEEPSDEKAAIFFQKTCNIDPTRGCYEAAELMASGKVSAREGEVESLYNIACEHGNAEACTKRSLER